MSPNTPDDSVIEPEAPEKTTEERIEESVAQEAPAGFAKVGEGELIEVEGSQFEEPVLEPYQHRDVDDEGNPDDKFTEEEALQNAADEGIFFVDSFHLVRKDDISTELPESYETQSEAESERRELEDADDYQVVQRRSRRSE